MRTRYQVVDRLISKCEYLWRQYVLRDAFTIAHSQWVKDNGDERLRYDYTLDQNSIVFDLGGYHGEFAERIYELYGCEIYVFEPVKEFYDIIESKFDNNQKIHVFDFGLSDKDESIDINISDDASSIYQKEGKKEKIDLRSISSFVDTNAIERIDLFKINIEGGEFIVLPELIQSGLIKKIGDLQIQFHMFIDRAEERRAKIKESLSKTHKSTYDYYFVWENWTRHG